MFLKFVCICKSPVFVVAMKTFSTVEETNEKEDLNKKISLNYHHSGQKGCLRCTYNGTCSIAFFFSPQLDLLSLLIIEGPGDLNGVNQSSFLPM